MSLITFTVICWLASELVVTVWAVQTLGVLNTLAALILVSVVGAWITKRVGLGAFRRVQQSRNGAEVDKAVMDGFLIMAAGILLVIPGFVSGAIGGLLLLRPVRFALRGPIGSRMGRRRKTTVIRGDGSRTEVWDVESWEESRPASGERGIGSGQ